MVGLFSATGRGEESETRWEGLSGVSLHCQQTHGVPTVTINSHPHCGVLDVPWLGDRSMRKLSNPRSKAQGPEVCHPWDLSDRRAN